ncbi:MAG: exodeoxyribonuclease III [Candidatus Dormibacteria bacterium]
MRVASWNINSLPARLPRVLAWIEKQAPDILLLQETKCTDEAFPAESFRQLGYASAHHGEGRWNGVAVLSSQGLAEVTTGLPLLAPSGSLEARYLAADCAGIRVASVYVPNGREIGHPYYDYKLHWLEALRRRVVADQISGRQVLLLGGDFNVARTDSDVYDPAAFVGATHVSRPERDALNSIMATGLEDLARRDSPDPGFTFWDYRQGFFRRGLGMRIDLLLASGSLADRLSRVWVDREERAGERPSDHAPVVADLDDQGGGLGTPASHRHSTRLPGET